MSEIATKDLVVHDSTFGVDRQIVAGQAVAPELLDAYAAQTGTEVSAAPAAASYDSLSVEDLNAEVARRGLTVTGSGKDGNVLKSDLVAALKADDAK